MFYMFVLLKGFKFTSLDLLGFNYLVCSCHEDSITDSSFIFFFFSRFTCLLANPGGLMALMYSGRSAFKFRELNFL